MPSVKAWGAVLALSVFCTVAGYVLFFHLIKTVRATARLQRCLPVPRLCGVLGWLVLGEPITFNVIAGMACVLFGTALVVDERHPAGRPLHGSACVIMCCCRWRLRCRRCLFAAVWWRGFAAIPRCSGWKARRCSPASATACPPPLPKRPPPIYASPASLTTPISGFRSPAATAGWRNTCAWMPRQRWQRRALFVTFHYGGGWWLTRYLRTLGLPISIVMQRGPDAANWSQRILLWFGTLRMKTIERVCGAPLIYTDWGHASRGARGVLKAWKDGTSVLALIDLPPPLVDRSAAVQFLGATAYFPPSLIELAHRQQRPIHVFIGQWNRDTLQPELKVVSLNASSAEASLQAAVTLLEGAVQQRPGAWHGWGDVGLYFQRPAG